MTTFLILHRCDIIREKRNDRLILKIGRNLGLEIDMVFTMRHHARAVYAVVVCLSVTSRCCTETAKHRIAQKMPHDSPVFWCQ